MNCYPSNLGKWAEWRVMTHSRHSPGLPWEGVHEEPLAEHLGHSLHNTACRGERVYFLECLRLRGTMGSCPPVPSGFSFTL